MKFKLFRSSSDGLYYFHLQSGNNKIIMASEGYKQKPKALKTLDKINRAFAVQVKIFDAHGGFALVPGATVKSIQQLGLKLLAREPLNGAQMFQEILMNSGAPCITSLRENKLQTVQDELIVLLAKLKK